MVYVMLPSSHLMNLSEQDNMSTEASVVENADEIKAVSSLTDLDFGIGGLSVSHLPYESSWVRTDESSTVMLTSDVSAAAGLTSACDSISFAECPELRDGRAENTFQSDTVGFGCGADLPGQSTEGKAITVDSSDLVKIAESSTVGDGEAEVVDEIEKKPQKSNDHLIVYTSSRRNGACIISSKLNQSTDSQKPSRTCRTVAQEDSESDLKSLKILRRRRSLFSKRARSSVWGSVGVPAVEQQSLLDSGSGNGKKKGRARGGQGKKKAIRDQAGQKPVQKNFTPTRHITLKIKIGNQSCGVVNVAEKINAKGKNVPALCDITESKFGEKLPGDALLPNESILEKVTCSDASDLGTHLNVTGTVENTSFSSVSDIHQIISHGEADNLRASTENRCSDPGTSPDSEVINSIPDASHYSKGSLDMQDGPVIPMERSKLECFTNSNPDVPCRGVSSLSLPQMKSGKGKKKDKHFQFADCSMENRVSGAEAKHNSNELRQKVGDVSKRDDSITISTANRLLNTCSSRVTNGLANCSRMTDSGTPSTGGEGISSSVFADATEFSNPQACNSLLTCSNDKKSPKCSSLKGDGRLKGGCKSRFGLSDIPSKRAKASKKKGAKTKFVVKHQTGEKDYNSGFLSGMESYLAAGNQTSSDLGENGDLSKCSSGPVNSLSISSGGLKGQHAPPRNAWVLCDECQKWRRIPAPLADQIEETNCQWTCKDNTDKVFADCSIPQEKSNSEINEELEISDASCDEGARETSLKSSKNQLNGAKPFSWSLIKSNLFLHRSRKSQTIDEVMVCDCKPPSDGRMGCGAKCLNRMLNIECVQGTCPIGELCSNQQFQKRIYAKLKWFRCGKKGFGLQALQDMFEGQFVIEYVGEVLDIHAYEARQREYAVRGHRHFYFMTLNGSEVIDACAKGNLGRFINHSCDPNCRTEKWMVNGEVCVGLFAIRDIKKGEELTFDYNYVRVFGAAAKKCVCGSSNCRGYIGGDPTTSDIIVQGDSDDESVEPVMICEDREISDEWNDIMSHSFCERKNGSAIELQENKLMMMNANAAGQFECITSDTLSQKVGANPTSPGGCLETSADTRVEDVTVQDDYQPDSFVGNNFASNAAVGFSDTRKGTGVSLNGFPSATSNVDSEVLQSQKCSAVKLMDVSFQPEGMNSTKSSALHFAHGLEMSATPVPSKSQLDNVESTRKSNYVIMGGKEELNKSDSPAKIYRSSSSIKKEKIKPNVTNDKGTPTVDKSNGASHKPKKLQGPGPPSHFEAVEEKLNELLDTEGGISKRKDASRGYLKLLFLTAAFGTSGHGEAIQSNRDLSMILDALLKTKSRTVLIDVINKNGLQMLHNIMKRYRKEFIKTPILRKLLKVLEYLAMREILTLEHITGGPPRPGVESFKDSILTLTEHVDKQVHQIARNFRDRWIPRSLRKNCFMERDDGKAEFHQQSSYGKLSLSSADHWSGQGGKTSESIECCNMETVVASGGVETATQDHSLASGTRTRKRKSRWDSPEEDHMHPRFRTSVSGDGKPRKIDEDIPPGFSSPCKDSTVPAAADDSNRQEREACVKHPVDIVLADSQERFIARMPVSYGVPSSIVQQFGVVEAEAANVWSVAPGMPFHPFPPLPPHANNKGNQPASAAARASVSESGQEYGTRRSGKKRATMCSLGAPDTNNSVGSQPPDSEGCSYNLGRKYFRQQKWNHSKLAPPWVRMRNGWGGHTGNPRNGMLDAGFGNPCISEDFDWRGEF